MAQLNTKDVPSDWYPVRIRRLKSMFRNLVIVTLLGGLLSALQKNTICMAAPGRFGCPEKSPEEAAQDYGLFYNTGYAIAYVYDCIFLSIWIPFFNGWVKDIPVSKGTLDGINNGLLLVNSALFGGWVGYQGFYFLANLYAILVYRDSMGFPYPIPFYESHRSWNERILLVGAAGTSIFIGWSALHTLELVDFAKVKSFEYWLVVVPALLVFGLRLASLLQRKMEQRVVAAIVAKIHEEDGIIEHEWDESGGQEDGRDDEIDVIEDEKNHI